MKRIIKEPLFQFLLLGAFLFAIYFIVNPKQKENEIVVDDYLIKDLATKWEMQRNRQPSINELKGLIELFIEQEVMYKEALAMNLDHNDEIIKRRLAKKMEFISDELAESLQPTDNVLREYYNQNKDNYQKPSIYTLRQIFFNRNQRDSAEEDAKKALKNEDPVKFGDRISLPAYYSKTNALKLSIDFGTVFSASLDTLPIGVWAGPVRSGFGVHLVFIEEKIPSGFYTYDDVSEKVNLDYNFYASKNFKKELVSSLRKKYNIKFEIIDSQLKEALSEGF